MEDILKIVDDVKWCAWAGGEYIGGTNTFFQSLYNDICSFKASYWENIENNLFHVGDEMLTSIALCHLREVHCTVDAGMLGYIYRYWSIYENLGYMHVGASLVHFSGDKEFFYNADLNADAVSGIMSGYKLYRVKSVLKGLVKKILDKDWKSKL